MTTSPKRRMTPKVPVLVTQAMINDAVRGDSGHCMIAEAVKAAFPGAANVAVDIQTIRFTDLKTRQRYIYLTPRLAQQMLVNFDMGQSDELQPFSVTLRSGQVTKMRGRPSGRKAPAGAWEKGLAVANEMKSERAENVKVHIERGGYGIGAAVTGIEGGIPPPVGALASGRAVPRARRRQFGLRALDRGSSVTLRTEEHDGQDHSPLTP